MEIKVIVYINGQYVPHEDLHKYEIRNNATIDRIFNSVRKRHAPESPQETGKAEEPDTSDSESIRT